MSTNYYDKEHTKKIECFYDPCYRTGDFYKVCYLNNGSFDKSSVEIADLLYHIVTRSEGEVIYFIDSIGTKLKLKPIKIEEYIGKTNMYLFWFKTEDGFYLVYDEYGYLIDKFENLEMINGICYNHADNLDIGCQLISYSFVENYNEKDNVINPNSYKDARPMSEEELDIVKHRMSDDPYYKNEEYARGR